MYRGTSRYFKVVQNQTEDLNVWHANAQVCGDWQETGHYGSESQCWDYIETCELGQGYLFNVHEFEWQIPEYA